MLNLRCNDCDFTVVQFENKYVVMIDYMMLGQYMIAIGNRATALMTCFQENVPYEKKLRLKIATNIGSNPNKSLNYNIHKVLLRMHANVSGSLRQKRKRLIVRTSNGFVAVINTGQVLKNVFSNI